ncbi:hypothetical protein C8J57DRAFT_1062900, partial [Mycena rebaudengoi]
VTKIKWANSGTVPLKASGVEFASAAGGTARFTALARREVIIAGGAIQLSGIGDSAIIGPLGIHTEIDLKTVGRNLQEQARCSTISYEAGTINSLGANGNGFDKGGRGPSDCIAFPNIYQLFGSQASAKVSQIQSSLATWATSQATSALSAAALQTNLIINKNGTTAAPPPPPPSPLAPVVELFYDPGFPDDLGIDMWQLLPFSRGNVKITPADPFTAPSIRANYFSVGLDLDVQVAGARLSRRILTSPPLNTLSAGETIPGSQVPDDANRGSDAASVGTRRLRQTC